MWFGTEHDHRTVIKFYCLRNKSATKTFKKMKEVYGDRCLSRCTVLRWHAAFMKGQESTELLHMGWSGPPKTASGEVNVNTIWVLIEEDCSLTCHQMAAIMNYSKTTIENIVKHEVRMCYLFSTWVPHHLTRKQLCDWVDACKQLKERYQKDPSFMCHVNHLRWNMGLPFRPANTTRNRCVVNFSITTLEENLPVKVGKENHTSDFFRSEHHDLSAPGPEECPGSSLSWYGRLLWRNPNTHSSLGRKRPELKGKFILHQDNA